MKVGYLSACTISVVGPHSDMMEFFDVINKFVVSRRYDVDLSIITDRLYRRYIKQDQADHSEQIMRLIETEFSQIKPRGGQNGFMDASGNEWTMPRGQIIGVKHRDVQTPDGGHLNVTSEGEIDHGTKSR